jgi:hypothetical protein
MNRPLRTRMMGGVGGVGEYLPQPDYVAVFNRQPNCYAQAFALAGSLDRTNFLNCKC